MTADNPSNPGDGKTQPETAAPTPLMEKVLARLGARVIEHRNFAATIGSMSRARI